MRGYYVPFPAFYLHTREKQSEGEACTGGIPSGARVGGEWVTGWENETIRSYVLCTYKAVLAIPWDRGIPASIYKGLPLIEAR